jgi:hypothetical protein
LHARRCWTQALRGLDGDRHRLDEMQRLRQQIVRAARPADPSRRPAAPEKHVASLLVVSSPWTGQRSIV